jgi:hypothetical protein
METVTSVTVITADEHAAPPYFRLPTPSPERLAVIWALSDELAARSAAA